jgi:uncharacterized protein YndB with AHSA1/START domain
MRHAGKIIHPGTIRFERTLSGSPTRIWEYLTEPALISTWLADASINLSVGGEVELRKKDGALVNGKITKCEAPRLLSYSWKDSAVTFEVDKSEDAGVTLVLSHSGLQPAHIHKFFAGWHTHLEILSARLRGDNPESYPLLFEHFSRSYKNHLEKLAVKEAQKKPAVPGAKKERRKTRRGNDFV